MVRELESLAFGISEPGFFLLGGEMGGGRKFVGMQDLRCSGHVPHEHPSIPSLYSGRNSPSLVKRGQGRFSEQYVYSIMDSLVSCI